MTCRRAAELVSRELDLDLPFRQRLGMRLHLLYCNACRRFRRQLGIVDSAVAEFLATADAGDSSATLLPSAKRRLKAAIFE